MIMVLVLIIIISMDIIIMPTIYHNHEPSVLHIVERTKVLPRK